MDNLIIVSALFPPEPVVSAQISRDIASELSEEGKDVTVLVPVPSRPWGFDFEIFKNNSTSEYYKKILPKAKVITMSSLVSPKSNFIGRLRESISFGKAVSNYLLKNYTKNSIVYINSWPIFSQYIIGRTCKRLNIPYVIHVQDIYPESLTNKLPKILGYFINVLTIPFERYYLNNASKIIVISNIMRAYLSKSRKIDLDHFAVVHNWQDENAFDKISSDAKEKEKFTFMYLGNIGPVAGLPFIIKAFAKSQVNAKLSIAGTGSSLEQCISVASSYQDLDIEFLDVPDGQVAEIQAGADVFLLPLIAGASNSSIPSKLPAYMFSAKPILASVDLGSETERCIIEGDCGWVAESENEERIIELFRNIVEEPKHLIDQKGSNAYNYAINFFSKKENLRKLIKVLGV